MEEEKYLESTVLFLLFPICVIFYMRCLKYILKVKWQFRIKKCSKELAFSHYIITLDIQTPISAAQVAWALCAHR